MLISLSGSTVLCDWSKNSWLQAFLIIGVALRCIDLRLNIKHWRLSLPL